MKISFVVPIGDVINEARDKFLTSCIGGCWHETTGETVRRFASDGFTCSRCGMFFTTQNDYSMPEDFLKLYQWARNNSSLDEFTKQFRPADFMNEKKGPHMRKEFADGLYTILSTRREKGDL